MNGSQAPDTQTATAGAKPRYMRSEPLPQLPFELESAIPKRIVAGPAALNSLRSAAASALRKAGLPHSGSEDFSFVRTGEFLPHLGPPAANALARLAGGLPSRADIERHLVSEARESFVVLVDGIYVPELSKPGTGYQVGLLAQADSLHGDSDEELAGMVSQETDAAAAMAMLFAEPLHIRLAAKEVPASPLLVLRFSSGSSQRSDAFLVYQGAKLSEGRILVRHAVMGRATEQPAEAGSKATGSMRNQHTLALIDESASLKFFEAGPVEALDADGRPETAGAPAAIAAKAIHFGKLTARLGRNARLSAVSAHTGSRLTRHSFAIDLAGEGAEAEINGAAVLTGSHQSHNFVRIRHLVPHCVSRQHFKSVAADQSRSSVDGTIYVAPGAQQTNAYQLINNLMLSDEARADSKPRLMIHADDVKCSHGSTSSQISDDEIFYLRARGLDPVRARQLIARGFSVEVIARLGDEKVEEMVLRFLDDKFAHIATGGA